MKLKLVPFAIICILLSLNAQTKRTIGAVDRLHPELDQYISPGAEIEILAEGFGWSEGPVWVNRLDAILFSDVPANKIYRWDEKNGLGVFLDPSGYTGIAPRGKEGSLNAENRDESGSNGLVLDANGQLTICMHGDRRVAKLEKRKAFQPSLVNIKENISTVPMTWFSPKMEIYILPTLPTA